MSGSQTAAIEVLSSGDPISCPVPGQSAWDKHPRVYLSLDKTGTAVCPYCDQTYRAVTIENEQV